MDNKGKFSGIFVSRTNLYLWIIFLLTTVITFLKIWVAIPCFVLLIFLVYYNYRSNHLRQSEITKYIENLNFNINTATKDTLLNFPLPLVLVNLDGTIIWYNSSFRKIFTGEDLFEKTIETFISGLKPDILQNETTEVVREININGRYYRVLSNMVKMDVKSEDDQFIIMLYLIDITEFVEIKKKYAEEKPGAGIIVIDNYDDLMQSMEDSKRPYMLAEIEGKIVQWMGFSGGIVKKFERDKYIFIYYIKYLKEFEDRKFDILDTVKEINLGNKIPVTLSLGFGINGKTLFDNFISAGASIDIALGRGGDHVVIKDGDNFKFYGGKTRELEKRTRVKARVIAYALRELIDQSPFVIIMGHENCDIDCLGAALGIYRIVRNRGKDAFIVMDASNPAIDSLIIKIEKDPDYKEIFINRNEAAGRIDKKVLLIVLDTHRPAFTESPELLKLTGRIVVIDHHRKGAEFIQDAVLNYQETYASSTSELVTEILQYVEEKAKLKLVEAEALYAGIVVDTKNFTFKTGVRTFEAAAFLRRQGVDTISVKQLFQNDLHSYITISDIVKAAEIINNNIALSACPPNTKNAQIIAAQAADQLLSLSGLVAAFVLCSVNNEVLISGRSLGDINVQMILEKLGGGGHLTVAGAQLEGISLESAKDKLKYVIIEYINEMNSDDRQ